MALLRRALALQQRRLDAVWENRATDSPLKTPAELLTLASVVEKETGHVLDREMVASVFTNRLRKGVPLLVANLGPATFNQDHNTLLLVDEAGHHPLPSGSKTALARRLVEELAQRLPA